MSFLKAFISIKTSLRYVRDCTRRLGLEELYRRRMQVGPEKPRHRSEYSNWNYEAEVFAFGKRVKENFDLKLLRQAFVDKSYFETEDNTKLPDNMLPHNDELKNYGYNLTRQYVQAFLIQTFQDLPAEWIDQISNHLLSTKTIGHVSGYLGTKDLIMCNSIEVDIEKEANVLFAIIGALAKSQNENVAYVFIKDFILTQLTTIHLCDIIQIDKGFDLLTGVLLYYKKGPPKSRLLRQSGMNSIYACYRVGIYSDEDMIGEAAGESLLIAEDMAVKHSLINLFGISENRPTINFKDEIKIDFNLKPSNSVADYLKCLENK